MRTAALVYLLWNSDAPSWFKVIVFVFIGIDIALDVVTVLQEKK